jgi:PqqD family protein of HPr-rel-A system
VIELASEHLWSVDPAGRFAIRSFDDEAVAYDTKTGNTHLLDQAASALVTFLRDSPQFPADLARRLAEHFEFPPDEDILALTESTLFGLRELGLVLTVPIEDR